MNYYGVYHQDYLQRNGSICDAPCISKGRMLLCAHASATEGSLLAMISGVFAPLFAPLGFGDWRVVTSLVTGFMAKESVVSSLTLLYGSSEVLLASLTPVAAASLLVFSLLYTPCVAAVSAVKRELGGKWALGVVLGQCALAWVAALAVRLIGILFGGF